MNRPRRHAWAGLALATGLAVTLAACGGGGGSTGKSGNSGGGKPQMGGTLHVIGASDVDHLDPVSAYYVPDSSLFHAVLRQLFMYPVSTDLKKQTQLVPDIAAQIPTKSNGGISSDGKTYTIKLKSNVFWNTKPARAVTASDELLEMKRLCNPASPVGAPGYYESTILGMKAYCDGFAKVKPTVSAIKAYINGHDIPGVQAKDAHTIVFKLTQPASDFLNIISMGFASPVPKEYLDYVPDSPQMRAHFLSNGPYQISSYTANKQIMLTRNPAWKQASDSQRHQYVSQIVVKEGQSNPDSALQQIKVGTQDLLWDLPVNPPQVPALLKAKDNRLGIYPSYDTNPYLVFNLVTGDNGGALKKLQVREAIAYAIDKTAINKVYGGPNLGTPLNQIIPPGNAGYKQAPMFATAGNNGDPAKCKSLLAKAGYKPGQLVLKDVARNAGVHPQVAQSVQADLKRCGITTKIVSVSQGDYYAKYLENVSATKRGVWDITEAGWVPDWYGPTNGRSMIQPLFDGRTYGPNSVDYGDYNNPKVNALIDKALQASSAQQASSYWSQAGDMIMKDLPIVPFRTEKTAVFHSSKVHNAIYLLGTGNYDWTNLWLSK